MKEQKNIKNNIWRIIILILCVIICVMVLAFFVSPKNQEVNNKIESGEINQGNTTSGEINKNEENNIEIERGEIDITAVKQEDGTIAVNINTPSGLEDEEKEKIINNKFNKTEFMVTTKNEKPSIDDANWKEYVAGEKYILPQQNENIENVYVWYKNGDEINSISNDGIMLLAADDNYEVNGAYYYSLEYAYNAISSTGTIKVMQDVTDTSALSIASYKNITIDMNGKTIEKKYRQITINGGTLSIKGNGRIETNIERNTSINNGSHLIEIVSGTLNVGELNKEGPTIIDETHAQYDDSGMIKMTKGTINIYSGKLEADWPDDYNSAHYMIDYKTRDVADVNIYGGTLETSGYGVGLIDLNACPWNVRIGTKDGVVNKNSPILRMNFVDTESSSSMFSFRGGNDGKIYFYDGLIEKIDPHSYASAYEDVNIFLAETETNWKLARKSLGRTNGCYTTQAYLAPNQQLMQRESGYVGGTGFIYPLGAYRESKEDYTTDKIRTIIIQDTLDGLENAIDSWDVSEDRNGSIKAWVVKNSIYTSKYDLHIGANGKIFAPESSSGLFREYEYCTEIKGLELLDVSNVTNMMSMFYQCHYLENIGDIGGWNTGNVTNMSDMFSECRNLANVGDLSSWQTENVTTMRYMFYDCQELVDIGKLSDWQTGKVINMSDIFSHCYLLTDIGDLSNWNTGNVTNMFAMFNGCYSLKDIGDLSKWDTSKVTHMGSMFCSTPFTEIKGISGWNTENVTYMYSVFKGCSNLTSIDISGWNTKNVTYIDDMFTGCSSLKTVILGNNFDRIVHGYSSVEVFIDSPTAIITPRTTPFTFGSNMTTENAILYVPSVAAEAAFETAENATKVFSEDRIRPILELVGDSTINLKLGENYTDAGATVAGFKEVDKAYYEKYGYKLTSSGAINTSIPGEQTITYTLTKDGNEVMSVTRKVIIAANYMDNSGIRYLTLNEAFTKAVTGSTITALENVTETTRATLPEGKKFILNLDGKTITYDGSSVFIVNNGNLEVKDATGNGKISINRQGISEYVSLLNNGNDNAVFTLTSGTFEVNVENQHTDMFRCYQ